MGELIRLVSCVAALPWKAAGKHSSEIIVVVAGVLPTHRAGENDESPREGVDISDE